MSNPIMAHFWLALSRFCSLYLDLCSLFYRQALTHTKHSRLLAFCAVCSVRKKSFRPTVFWHVFFLTGVSDPFKDLSIFFSQYIMDLKQKWLEIGQLKTGKMLPGLMSLDFCWDIQMVESEFGLSIHVNESINTFYLSNKPTQMHKAHI